MIREGRKYDKEKTIYLIAGAVKIGELCKIIKVEHSPTSHIKNELKMD